MKTSFVAVLVACLGTGVLAAPALEKTDLQLVKTQNQDAKAKPKPDTKKGDSPRPSAIGTGLGDLVGGLLGTRTSTTTVGYSARRDHLGGRARDPLSDRLGDQFGDQRGLS
ncbi:hypothetical protein XA68_16658 [Ophiocordyceps unilateralis]|uniref:Uncharacterized protein n=1 Tax=Ophiocordyceps unilateralis TaxID=268505 RepID=A0A2A9PPC7_OPHUN|nr:hypothetical protein XA68_16658 [Ophiocordyceps unilateralis]